MAFNSQKEIDLLLNKCDRNALGCFLYKGEKEKTPVTNDYGFKKIKYPDQNNNVLKCYNARVHKHMFMLSNNIHPRDSQHLTLSHLCHNKRCINIRHLNNEPQAVNNGRKTCVNIHRCIGHVDYPNCIF
jgi:hypothetical protein